VFTARYALSSYIKQTRFVFKGLNFRHDIFSDLFLNVRTRCGCGRCTQSSCPAVPPQRTYLLRHHWCPFRNCEVNSRAEVRLPPCAWCGAMILITAWGPLGAEYSRRSAVAERRNSLKQGGYGCMYHLLPTLAIRRFAHRMHVCFIWFWE
jgi:hypothetical protein